MAREDNQFLTIGQRFMNQVKGAWKETTAKISGKRPATTPRAAADIGVPGKSASARPPMEAPPPPNQYIADDKGGGNMFFDNTLVRVQADANEYGELHKQYQNNRELQEIINKNGSDQPEKLSGLTISRMTDDRGNRYTGVAQSDPLGAIITTYVLDVEPRGQETASAQSTTKAPGQANQETTTRRSAANVAGPGKSASARLPVETKETSSSAPHPNIQNSFTPLRKLVVNNYPNRTASNQPNIVRQAMGKAVGTSQEKEQNR